MKYVKFEKKIQIYIIIHVDDHIVTFIYMLLMKLDIYHRNNVLDSKGDKFNFNTALVQKDISLLTAFIVISGKSRLYHMNYYGETCETGWVFSSSIMKFEGKTAFDEFVSDQLQFARKAEKVKLEKLYKVPGSRLHALKIAIQEAEAAAGIVSKGWSMKLSGDAGMRKTAKRRASKIGADSEVPAAKRMKVAENEKTGTSFMPISRCWSVTVLHHLDFFIS